MAGRLDYARIAVANISARVTLGLAGVMNPRQPPAVTTRFVNRPMALAGYSISTPQLKLRGGKIAERGTAPGLAPKINTRSIQLNTE